MAYKVLSGLLKVRGYIPDSNIPLAGDWTGLSSRTTIRVGLWEQNWTKVERPTSSLS